MGQKTAIKRAVFNLKARAKVSYDTNSIIVKIEPGVIIP